MPAMQYIAFTVREVAELVSLRGHALERAAMLKERVATAVDTCKAVLDLEARVKRLQVKTQQVRTHVWTPHTKMLLFASCQHRVCFTRFLC